MGSERTIGTGLQGVHSAALRALGAWDLDADSLEFVVARENAVFRARRRDGRWAAVRVLRPGYHDAAELQSEVEWITALISAGIDTPAPMATRDGRYFVTAVGDDGLDRTVGVVEWIDGEPLAASLLDDRGIDICRQLGELMARFHDHACAWVPSPAFTRHRLDAEGLLGDDPWWGRFWEVPEIGPQHRPAIDAARRSLREVLDRLGTSPSTFSLIHADLLPQNVLVRDGRPYVIDFDDAAFGWHHYDMAVALYDIADGVARARRRAALLDGYRRVRVFPAADEALLPAFHVLRQLQVIGWLHPRIDVILRVNGRAESRAEVMAGRLERVVDDIDEWLSSD